MSGGGSGGSGTTQYNWNDTMKPYWEQALSQGQQLSNKPYEAYPYQRIAPMNDLQNNAISLGTDMVYAGGMPVTHAADQQAQNTLEGGYMPGRSGGNPFATATNPYMGYGPAFQDQLQGQLGDITNAYNHGTSADTTRLFNLSGAFGGSAHQNAIANNEAALGKTLANATANAYQNQFNQSAGLAEQGLNRGMTGYENERGRQMQAIGQGNQAQQNFFQSIQQLMGYGDIQRANQQDQYNQAYNDWQTQQQYPYTQLDYLTGLLGRAQGGISPNSTTQTSGYSASPYSQILGAGLLGYGMTH